MLHRMMQFRKRDFFVLLVLCTGCLLYFWKDDINFRSGQIIAMSTTTRDVLNEANRHINQTKYNAYQDPPVKSSQGPTSAIDKLKSIPTDYNLNLPGQLSALEMKNVIMEYIRTVTYTCKNESRFGKTLDGGWDVCMDVGIKPNSCIVFSVGISNDWSFDEDIAAYGCKVYAFDPTIGLNDQKHSDRVWFYNIGLYGENVDDLLIRGKHWKVRTLSAMRKMLNHEHDIIDVLKFDIEDGEYQIFNQLIESGILQDIKLVSFELHLGHMKILENADTGLLIYRALKVAFEKNNFKLWRWHENESMAKQHPENAYCWTEVYWINMKFVKNKK